MTAAKLLPHGDVPSTSASAGRTWSWSPPSTVPSPCAPYTLLEPGPRRSGAVAAEACACTCFWRSIRAMGERDSASLSIATRRIRRAVPCTRAAALKLTPTDGGDGGASAAAGRRRWRGAGQARDGDEGDDGIIHGLQAWPTF